MTVHYAPWVQNTWRWRSVNWHCSFGVILGQSIKTSLLIILFLLLFGKHVVSAIKSFGNRGTCMSISRKHLLTSWMNMEGSWFAALTRLILGTINIDFICTCHNTDSETLSWLLFLSILVLFQIGQNLVLLLLRHHGSRLRNWCAELVIWDCLLACTVCSYV